MKLESIKDILTWFCGENQILIDSLEKEEITKKEFSAGINTAIQRCVKEIMILKKGTLNG